MFAGATTKPPGTSLDARARFMREPMPSDTWPEITVTNSSVGWLCGATA
jgi:hypothetical protein